MAAYGTIAEACNLMKAAPFRVSKLGAGVTLRRSWLSHNHAAKRPHDSGHTWLSMEIGVDIGAVARLEGQAMSLAGTTRWEVDHVEGLPLVEALVRGGKRGEEQ